MSTLKRGWFNRGSKDGLGNEAEGANAEDQGQGPFASNSFASTAHNVASFYRVRSVFDRRIHILGMGSVGRFIAHSLRGIPNPPPITMIFHRPKTANEWKKSAQKLQLVTGDTSEKREGYEVELAIPRPRFHGKEIGVGGDSVPRIEEQPRSSSKTPYQPLQGESSDPIHSLIVCTKTPAVLSALSSVKHRLHRNSVILFLQNGMGAVEEVNREVFPDPETRPYYMVGINTHGMYCPSDDPFTAVHAGFGTISLGLLPHERERHPAPYQPTLKFGGDRKGPSEPLPAKGSIDPDPESLAPTSVFQDWTPNSRYLLRTLLRTPVLCAAAFSPPDLLQMQLEKLAVNCIINPLTVMLDARNGAILYNYHFTRVIRLLLSEISLIFRNLPELQYIPNVPQRFDPGRLETIVVSVAHKTKDNISSMLADVRAGRKTEVDYLNGWIVKRGEEMGVKCLMNYMLLNMVKGKGGMIQMEIGEHVPFVEPREGEDPMGIRSEYEAQGETSQGGDR
ncbi:hypothetical protein CC78DRAFT_515341 [Lojkania enalia]|uniref:2-dehydropantoate 2-reductase n=1 Tax=Lojkania enalia TaxID=147567 RepID=A0A9P4N4Y4_9PLEO|nr:hypothetical protein CC78DRAFT_515341 [Didymosphaeria enalia]